MLLRRNIQNATSLPPSLPPAPTPPRAVNVTLFEAVLGISRVDLRVAQKGWSVVPGP